MLHDIRRHGIRMNKLPLQPLSPVRRMLLLNVGGKNGFMGGALLYVTVWSHIDPLEHLHTVYIYDLRYYSK